MRLEYEVGRDEELQDLGVLRGQVKKKIWLPPKKEDLVMRSLKRHLERVKKMIQI